MSVRQSLIVIGLCVLALGVLMLPGCQNAPPVKWRMLCVKGTACWK